jgi:hypothetical protein
MPNISITDLPAALPLDGSELVPVVQGGVTVRTTTSAVAGSPAQTQTFLTKDQEPTLPNSRALAASTGITLTDGGALSTYTIGMNGAAASLNAAGNGFQVKTGFGTVTPRNLATSGSGISVSNGSGQSGNPTFQLTGLALAIANLSGAGLVTSTGAGSLTPRVLAGTANQITIVNSNGAAGSPTFSIANDPFLPGFGAVTIPAGTSSERPVGADAQIRFNTETNTYEGYAAGNWKDFSLSGGVTSFSADTTGFTPNIDTSGAITLGGILNPSNGGTGAGTLIGYVIGNDTSPFTASATIPTTDLSGTISNAQLDNSSTTINGVTIALGASGTIPAPTFSDLTIGTGLTGTSYNGSAPITIAIDSTVATLTGTQTLTGKTIDAASNTLSNIPNASLTNSSVTVGATSIALGASSLTLGGLTSVAVTQDPTTALQLTTKQYVDAVAEGLHVHASCDAATSATLASITSGTVTYNNGTSGVGATLTLSNALTVLDTYSLQNGDRILVKNEATQANNGIYTWATGGTVLTRSTDFDTPTEIASGDFTFVTNGAIYASTGWVQTNEVLVVGTDPVNWVQFSGAGEYTAGTGLTLAGTQFSITNTAVTPASYGSASSVSTFTVNAQGQLTLAANASIAITNTQVSGLGTLSTQNANSVAITGGNIDGTIIGATTAAAGTFTTVIATTGISGGNF